MSGKWRPSIRLVVLAILLMVMALPVIGIMTLRLYENLVGTADADATRYGVVILGVLGVALVLGFVFVRAITGPMHELIDRTAKIAAGDGTAMRPLDHHGTQEMAELSDAFLDMARKLQARSDTIRTFATHVSHELKSPLTSIQGAAELLRDAGDEMDATTRARFQNNIVADADRMNRLVRRLIELARAENAGVSGETATLAEAVQKLNAIEGLAVGVERGAEVRFRMSSENAAIVISHLADNAAQHGATHLKLAAEDTDGIVRISAADDGVGISRNNRDRIFEPFFTTRRETGGTGLGLGIVSALLKSHEASIRLAPSDKGARFEIDVPRA
ncbi:MAG TPA: HAMP domain-containing sensor histidine kinase [Rhizobiaceae bacterium]|nr:HAMP domain-containing sensor histidine kinase [Rhizobiaceae bacterium]